MGSHSVTSTHFDVSQDLDISAPLSESEFKNLCLQCSRDIQLIVDGVVGSRVVTAVEYRDENGQLFVGRIAVEVFDYLNGRPAVRVIGSNFAPIPVVKGLYLPVKTLWWADLKEKLESPQMQMMQTRLWSCLRQVCQSSELRSRGRRQYGRQYPTPIHSVIDEDTVVPESGFEISSFDQSLAIPLRGIHLLEKPRFWKGANLFWTSAGNRGRAYFYREATLDGRKLRLVYADDDHPLAPLLDGHEAVNVSIADVLKESPKKGVSVGNLYDVREAQKEVIQYLRSMLSSIGYKPRR